MPDTEPLTVSVPKLRAQCDPFASTCWTDLDHPVTTKEVMDEMKRPVSEPLSIRQEHVARIARFATNGWDDPIGLDVGVPSLGCFPSWVICDGNHRFAAAVVRGDRTIMADISGSIDLIRSLRI